MKQLFFTAVAELLQRLVADKEIPFHLRIAERLSQ